MWLSVINGSVGWIFTNWVPTNTRFIETVG